MSNTVIKSLQIKDLAYKNFIYYLAYLIIVLKAFYAYTEFFKPFDTKLILNAGNLLLFIFLAYKVLFLQRYSVKQIFIFLILAIICFITDRKTNMFMFLPDFLLIISTEDIDFKNVIKKIYKIEAFILIMHFIVYAFLWFFNRSSLNFTVRLETSGELTVRHQLLLSHANIVSMITLWTILGFLYSEYETLNIKRILLAWLSYYILYQFTDSNSGLLILSFVTILMISKYFFENITESIVTFLSRYLYIILALFFNFLMVIFTKLSAVGREVWLSINDFFTGRLLFGAYAYDTNGFTLLGRTIPNRKVFWQGMWLDTAPCDNAYMWMSVGYGLVYTILIGYIFWKYSKNARFEEKLMIIAYSLYTMMELYVTYMYFSFPVIMIFGYYWKQNNNKKQISRSQKWNLKREYIG